MANKRVSEYQHLANQLGLIFFGCDGTMTQWSHPSNPLLKLFGISGRDLALKPDLWIEKTPERLRDQLKTDFESAGRGGKPGYLTFSLLSDGLGERTLKCNYCPMPALDEPVKFICTVEDITESTKFEREAAKALDHDIEVSARIQKALLTEAFSFEGGDMQIAAETLPSSKVDGDFFEFIQLDGGSMDFIVGDVMGKGISAALLSAAVKTSFLKSIIGSQRNGGVLPEIKSILSGVNRAIGSQLVTLENFCTLFYCRLLMDRPAVRFIDAGHTCFVYYNAKDESCWTVKGSNMPIGFMPQQDFRQFLLPLSKGDVLFFYSDGITEVMNSEGEQFGFKRLMHLISTSHSLSSVEIIKKILNVTFYFASSEFKDDVTAVVVKTTAAREIPLIERSYKELEFSSADLSAVREKFESDVREFLPKKRGADAFALALIEAVANSLVHTGTLYSMSWRIYDSAIEATLDWSGDDFDWYSIREPNLAEFQESGFGMYIIQTIADSVILMDGIGNRKRMEIFKELK